MKIISILKKKLSNLVYKVLFLHVFAKARHGHILPFTSDLLIITIAFNNADVIRQQHEYLRKNLQDAFDYLIADNSSNPAISEALRQFCANHHISYIRLPKNPLTGIRMSGSHGIALNWCYRNIIKKYKPRYFGFLDHDIFPLVPTGIIGNIQNGFWGVIRTRGSQWWYLWPGFCFFRYETAKKYRFNFFPYHAGIYGLVFLDTGGSNYYSIYRKVGRENIPGAHQEIIDLATKQPLIRGQDSRSTFELINNAWLHLRQISWREESFGKMSEQEKILGTAKELIAKN